jgi:phage tail sheath protein FI
MPNYLSPGVYVEEVEAGSRPIEGVGTAVAAFVGLAQRGPTNAPTLITNWAQFVNTYGDFMEGSYLAHAVYGYFLNGGGSCYVVRIGGDAPAPQARAEIAAAADGGSPGYRALALVPAFRRIGNGNESPHGSAVPDDGGGAAREVAEVRGR